MHDEWRDRAVCRGMDPTIFFPERGGDTALAKSICRTCPVQAECLAYALEQDSWLCGVWGGMNWTTRRAPIGAVG